MAYTFEQVFAADPANPANIAQNASVTIFAPGDGTMTPIAITDPDGQPLANPLTVNANGFGSAFMADIDRVAWLGGGFTGFFTSYEGMKEVAVAAQAAAETAASTAGVDAAAVATAAIGDATADAEAAAASAATAASNASASATAAANSAALVGAPADTAIAAAVNGTGATKTALNATYVAIDKVTENVARAFGWAIATDPQWAGGAKTDGTNATPAIIAALGSANKTVYLPAGEYTINDNLNITAYSGKRLTGSGATTVLQVAASVATAAVLGTSAGVTDFTLDNIKINMQWVSGQTAIHAVQVTNGSRITIDSLHILNSGGAGVLLQGLAANGGTPDSRVTRCVIDGTGLADVTTGFGIWIKDNSDRCTIADNRLKNIKGGMGIGMGGSDATGYPNYCMITRNTGTMVPSTTGFEFIGITTKCNHNVISNNSTDQSYDNGISVSGNYNAVVGNIIGTCWNHGISVNGSGNTVTGNTVRNVGRQDGLQYGGVSIDTASYNTVANNVIFDDNSDASPYRMSFQVKFVNSQGNNVVGPNSGYGWTVAQTTPIGSGRVASDALTLTDISVKASYATVFAVDPTYGDGVTDATAHIQSKIDAAVAAGGGTIYFPHGRYRASGLTGTGTLAFRGAGGADHRGGTRATTRAGAALMPMTPNMPIITLSTTLRLTWRDVDFVHDRSFKADAMILGTTPGDGSGTFWPDLDVAFSGFDGHALKIIGTFWECDLSNVHARRCGDGTNDKAAIEIDAQGGDGDTVRFSAPNVTFPRAVGFRMKSGANSTSTTGPGFRRLMFDGGMFHAGLDEDNVQSANRYDADMIVIDGFTSLDIRGVNVASTAAGRYAIRLDGSLTTNGSNRAYIEGNQFNGPIGIYKCNDVVLGRNNWAFWIPGEYNEHVYIDATAVRTVIEPQTIVNDGSLVVTDNSTTTRRPTDETVLIQASEFAPSTGSPTLSRAGARFPAWLLDAAVTEQVNAAVVIPHAWRRFHVEMLWSNIGPGAGDVRWSLGYSARIAGDALTAGDVFFTTSTDTAPAADVLAVKTWTSTPVTTVKNALYHFRLSRLGADAADTLANDASFLGIRLRRAA